jgi:hypothetical protein
MPKPPPPIDERSPRPQTGVPGKEARHGVAGRRRFLAAALLAAVAAGLVMLSALARQDAPAPPPHSARVPVRIVGVPLGQCDRTAAGWAA